MKPEYNLASMKSRPNPFAKKLKQQVTLPLEIMGFIAELQNNLIKEKEVYNLSRNREFGKFGFVGFKETATTIDFVALVEADKLTEKQIVDFRDSFFEIVKLVSYDFGLKPLARNPNGLLCFVFENSLPNHLANFIKKQTKISHFNKSAVTVSWAIDVKHKQIYTHNNPISLFPPVYIVEGWVFPGLNYLNSYLTTYKPQSVTIRNNAELSFQSFEKLERIVEEINKKFKTTSKYQNERYPENQRLSITIEKLIMENRTINTGGGDYRETTLNNSSRYIEIKDSGTYIENYNSSQDKTLAEAVEKIQKLLQQLEQTNPHATEEEKIKHINDKTTLKFKRKVVAALKAGGDTAIDEFMDNSYVKVGKAAIMGWIEG